MDPGRQAMIDGGKSPQRQGRDITGPRRDPNNRITKPSKPSPSNAAANSARFLSQDDQSRKFVADEDKFVLKQSKKKADIRVREGRARPVDYLAFNLRYIDNDRDVFDDDDGDIEIDVPSPERIVDGSEVVELKELESDITSFHTLESSQRNRDYWSSLLTLCRDRRTKLQGNDHEGRAVSSVSSDVDRILGPKTFEQLESLEKQIKAKLQSDEQIDTDYWQGLLRNLLVYKAKAKLRKICEAIKESRIEHFRSRNPARAEALASADADGSRAVDFSQATRALYEREVARGISENEEIFTAEEAVPSAAKPKWADKYRPRKPQYFNRVQMGYEWNKYNQTHYDHDNPPPKVVQGYKFNIFYPDLIDKTKAPTFKIIREGGRRRGESFAPAGEEDTCLLRFIAGPPYEDIAFRIVDREWDYSAKRDRGFRSSFDKGILQLHFQFKKVRSKPNLIAFKIEMED
ncbi:hypothetical protein UCDDA912_g04747 [Diaporthe ampelina]|uniref:Splicing factor Cactin n=1 Tax=Diaporthe ampelina TaxID=1214573 RepID=A0A0G2FLM4_9PEZI|nr:hypothetical protein UCDDA912_g04747 [Diaporthe ampelina]